MQNNYPSNESVMLSSAILATPSYMREWLFRLAKLLNDKGIFPYSYKLGCCDIFPLWFLSTAIAYMKESGDYDILEEIHLHNLFKSCYSLSIEYAGIIGTSANGGGQTDMEDTVSVGLYLWVCKEYLGLCRFLAMDTEAAWAAVRLRRINDSNKELYGQFSTVEWLPYFNEHLSKKTRNSIARGHIELHREIIQFIRSVIFEIMRLHSKKNAQNYWLSTSSIWSCKATTELIYGIKASFSGLSVNPCIPDCFGNYQINRSFRNAVYNISVLNPRHTTSDIRKLVVDNTEYLGNLLPNFSDGKTHRVEVIMGSFD